MNKILQFTFSLTLITLITLISLSCKKDKDKADDCAALGAKMNTVVTAWMNDPSLANCQAVKAAATEYLNSSCVTEAMRLEAESYKNQSCD